MNIRSNSAENKSANEKKGRDAVTNSQLQQFLEDSLRDIYWAEKALTKALPKLQKQATTEELRSAIGEHFEATQGHISRLEQVFGLIGKKAQAKKCEAMEGLIKEGESVVEETETGSLTRDVGIIMATQKMEHYEIATYGGLISLANTLGLVEVAELLSQTVEEEKDIDVRLTEIAENAINWEAEEDAGAFDQQENMPQETKMITLEEIYSHGHKVFEDAEKFSQWLHQPNKALANQIPYDLLENKESRIQVDDLIGRIEYGVYS